MPASVGRFLLARGLLGERLGCAHEVEGFLFGTATAFGSEVSLTDGALVGIRRIWGIAVCAFALMCVRVPSGQAQPQDTPAESPAKTTSTTTAAKPAPATAKVTTKSSPHGKAATSPSSAAKKSTGTNHTASAGARSSRKKKPVRARGQQKIDSERATSIQQALIREHYLSGEATGTWNQASEDAMRKYQADHGWQSKEVPDSRALIKLGLGPSKDHLLNPESAMTTGPDAPTAASTPSVPACSSTASRSPRSTSPNRPQPSPNPSKRSSPTLSTA